MDGRQQLDGIGVSPGIAFAPAMVVRWDFPDVPDRAVTREEVPGEIARLRQAVSEVAHGLTSLRERVAERAGPEESGIFDAQILMVQDEDYLGSVEMLIRNNLLSAETAFEFKSLELREAWAGAPRLRERLTDLTAVQRQVLHRLLDRSDHEEWSIELDEPVIVVAHELSPGVTVQLDREHVVGLVSEQGTRTSHAAILAHSLGIPAVMGVPEALDHIRNGTVLLIDGKRGTVLLDPTPADMDTARARLSRRHRLALELETAVGEPAVTPDGLDVALMGNVDLPEEIEPALRNGARGVGLVRTEFLVTGRAELPTEDEQFAYFRRVADAFRRDPVVIRAFDLGGDKFPVGFRAPVEANPFLGWRSIRVCLDQQEIFRPQLRAVLRAAVDRNIQLMLPLVTRIEEILESRALLEEEARALARDGVPAAKSVPVGVMVETPAAVILADRLAQVSDFFSVGTNDLTQYTMAADRGNARLASRFTAYHPAIIRQLKDVSDAGARQHIPVSICGEMASEPLAAVLLIGLGYRCLSVSPPELPLVKWTVRRVPFEAAKRAAAAALEAGTADEVRAAVKEACGSYLDLRMFDPLNSLPDIRKAASLPTDFPTSTS
ncbi:MAG: phosphoenolpyruvate--protein phosphotransferase [Gemmatimonadales bacterium]|nr:phosphoenolpyruvate--protein phosphotransferase [Gemmatimonadales bacterium]